MRDTLLTIHHPPPPALATDPDFDITDHLDSEHAENVTSRKSMICAPIIDRRRIVCWSFREKHTSRRLLRRIRPRSAIYLCFLAFPMRLSSNMVFLLAGIRLHGAVHGTLCRRMHDHRVPELPLQSCVRVARKHFCALTYSFDIVAVPPLSLTDPKSYFKSI